MDKIKSELSQRPIGVLDSGMGGISVVNKIRELLPNEDIIYYGDSAYAPYGTKPVAEVQNRVDEIVDVLMAKGVKAIVIACNTATSTSAKLLRDKHNLPILGMEPALKLAVDDGKKNIAVLATEITLKEQKFALLMERFSNTARIHRVPASELVEVVERAEITENAVHTSIYKAFSKAFAKDKAYDKAVPSIGDLDAIVLGCTHYLFAKDYIASYPNIRAKLFDGNSGTALNLRRMLSELGILKQDAAFSESKGMEKTRGNISIMSSSLKSIERMKKFVR